MSLICMKYTKCVQIIYRLKNKIKLLKNISDNND